MSFPGKSKARLFGCLAPDCVICRDADCSPQGEPVTTEEWQRHVLETGQSGWLRSDARKRNEAPR